MKGEPPKIAYLTLAFQPINIRHAIVNAIQQSYPHEIKTLYLMHQDPFPQQMTQLEVPFKVKEFNVRGVWANLWFLKVKRFCEVCTEPLVVLWDEDDRFEYEYTSKAVRALAESDSDATWNWWNWFVTKAGIFRKKHFEPIGTIVIKTDALRGAIANVERRYPMFNQGGGPLDTAIRKYLQEHFFVTAHTGMRYFFQHLKSSTRRKNKWEIDR